MDFSVCLNVRTPLIPLNCLHRGDACILVALIGASCAMEQLLFAFGTRAGATTRVKSTL
jgi:hypothetical protein